MAAMGATILLLQDAVYFPSYGGGNKANRLLLAALATRGFECHAVSRMPGERRILADRFSATALEAHGIAVETSPHGMTYRHDGVEVEALDLAAPDAAARIAAVIEAVAPDWILVS